MDSLPDLRFLTASLKVDYRKPTPLGVLLEIREATLLIKLEEDEFTPYIAKVLKRHFNVEVETSLFNLQGNDADPYKPDVSGTHSKRTKVYLPG